MKRYEHCTILTMDPKDRIIENGALVVDNGLIVGVGTKVEMEKSYPQSERVDLWGRLVIPGLINNHFHLAQALFRGFSDDMTIEPWLFERVWPLQAAHDEKTFLAGARLAMLEMSKSGTTTFVESMIVNYGLEALFEEVSSSGLRSRLAKVVMEPRRGSLLPPELTQTWEHSLEDAIKCRRKVRNKEMVDIWLGPRWTGMYNPHLIEMVNGVMDDEGFFSTIHFAEEVADVRAMHDDGYTSPGDFLRGSGMLERPYLLVHCPRLGKKDLDILKTGRNTIAHCPVSAMKMAMGYLDVPGLLERGVAVGIGTDAPACNNSSDLIGEMKTAALLHKHQSGKPDVLSAKVALGMGTNIGARSIFADEIIGSLEVGKRADFITLDLDLAAPLPLYNLPSSVVYSLCGRDVRDVFVDGRQLVKSGISLIYDEEKIRSEAREAMKTLLKRTNL